MLSVCMMVCWGPPPVRHAVSCVLAESQNQRPQRHQWRGQHHEDSERGAPEELQVGPLCCHSQGPRSLHRRSCHHHALAAAVLSSHASCVLQPGRVQARQCELKNTTGHCKGPTGRLSRNTETAKERLEKKDERTRVATGERDMHYHESERVGRGLEALGSACSVEPRPV